MQLSLVMGFFAGVEEGVARAFLGGGVTVDVWLVEHHNPFTVMDSPHEDFIQM